MHNALRERRELNVARARAVAETAQRARSPLDDAAVDRAGADAAACAEQEAANERHMLDADGDALLAPHPRVWGSGFHQQERERERKRALVFFFRLVCV